MAGQSNGDMAEASRIFSTFTDLQDTQSTVIIGAGIIGCATAYYLSQSGNTKPDTIHLVEASPELFASASGKAAGFVAPDWFSPASASLGSLSFQLHQELANQHDGRSNWGYSKSTAISLMEGSREAWMTGSGSHADPAWLTRRRADGVDLLSGNGGVAQIDPLRLSQFLLRESVLRGVRLHHPARAVRISKDDSGNISAVRVHHESGAEHKVPCTRLLLTAGAWTPVVFKDLFPASRTRIPISSLAGYSVVVKSPRWTKELESNGCDAVFTSMRSGLSPEIFSRIGEEIYVAGLNDPSLSLPEVATNAKIEPASIDELKNVSQRLLGKDGTDISDLQVLREGLCFRPVTRRGTPILCRIPDKDLGGIETKSGADGGVYVAAGHGPWGISLSLGTGKVMAEMMERQQTSANISSLGLR